MKKSKTLDERIELLEQFKEAFDSSKLDIKCEYRLLSNPDELIEVCKKLKALGYKWGDPLPLGHFRIVQGRDIYLSNKTSKYNFDPETYYILWTNGNVGCFQFMEGTECYDEFELVAQDAWKEFLEKLMSFKPLDYDLANCRAIYSITNGKKLMNVYPTLYKETQKKIDKTIKEKRVKKLLQEAEELQTELAKDTDKKENYG